MQCKTYSGRMCSAVLTIMVAIWARFWHCSAAGILRSDSMMMGAKHRHVSAACMRPFTGMECSTGEPVAHHYWGRPLVWAGHIVQAVGVGAAVRRRGERVHRGAAARGGVRLQRGRPRVRAQLLAALSGVGAVGGRARRPPPALIRLPEALLQPGDAVRYGLAACLWSQDGHSEVYRSYWGCWQA